MIFPPSALLDEIRAGKIVRNLSSRELSAPEGVGFDLCISEISEIGGGSGSLGVNVRRTPASYKITCEESGFFTLAPGKTYLATTVEHFELPEGLAAVFYPRSTLFRSGVIFQSSVLPHGYIGPMVFSLTNMHSEFFEIEIGARFAHVVFMGVSGSSNGYKGQWSGGRVSIYEGEEQI
jgi:dUTP pyrophosphatase